MRKNAMTRAGIYNPSEIMTRLVSQIGLADTTGVRIESEPAHPQAGQSFLEELFEIVSQ
jgi:hypothetical protein